MSDTTIDTIIDKFEQDYAREHDAQDKLRSALYELMLGVIGENEKQIQNDEDYSDWLVCQTCEVILIDESDPPLACNCTIRNKLKAEQRTKLTNLMGDM